MRPLIGLALMFMGLTACGHSDWEQTSEALSPDRQYRAVAEYKNAPASNSDHRRVRLVQQRAGKPPSGEVVVTATNADRATLHWETNDRLIVEACGATTFEVKARHFREPTFKENGEENAVRIETVSVSSLRNGRQLCAASSAK